MANIEREKEGQLSPEEIAAAQIDNYLERVEKHAEIDPELAGMVQQPLAGQVQMPKTITDDQGQVVAQGVSDEPEIDLPLSEVQVRQGLHHQVMDSLRWMAEWCIMIIKKYPGRVFYRQSQE